jgi:cephalosporin hydroxylase
MKHTIVTLKDVNNNTYQTTVAVDPAKPNSDKTMATEIKNDKIISVEEVNKENKENKDKIQSEIIKIKNTTDEFHKIWYPLQSNVSFLGHELMKNPLDLWIYQEIIYECKPDLIIECGTFKGGSALFLASICDLLHHGRVLTIDVAQNPTSPIHNRIDYAIGSSLSDEIIHLVDAMSQTCKKVMVILDSLHTKEHVLDELNLYSNFVTKGQYLIVEDSNIHGHPTREDLPPGPYEAIIEFMSDEENSRNFLIDKMCEKFLFTFNPQGYLRRMR